jgi:hypothetical protein
MGVTLRGRLASRLNEVRRLPDEKERAGSLQSPVLPRCNPQGHLHAVRSVTSGFASTTLKLVLPQGLQVQP